MRSPNLSPAPAAYVHTPVQLDATTPSSPRRYNVSTVVIGVLVVCSGAVDTNRHTGPTTTGQAARNCS
jgi:hypothetical protein